VSNIAEGQGRGSKTDFVKFLCIARGSLLELQTQFEIARELEFVGEAVYAEVMQLSFAELGLLNRLMQSLTSKQGAVSAG
ncbi:MAG TPA: four helix bundle protein, partial [Candidatus Acidoferrales bacterium]|nr:four helix bundle protein [Candidatus Acidoferrales bacterium]